jgi:C4-dicarboxylate-specific signal transduction histidine kinase
MALTRLPTGRLFVTAARENESVVSNVRDTGPGISAAGHTKDLHPVLHYESEGPGIGLALTHRIITQHGGTLTATNSPEAARFLRSISTHD